MAHGIIPVLGMPGIRSVKQSVHKHVFRGGFNQDYLPGGRVIDGTLARDTSNSGAVDTLQPGTLLGKVTSGGKYANSIYGLSTGALTGASTTLASSAAIAAEILRRKGATGTFKLTGPPTAGGTVRTLTVTYSNLNTSNGNITITAPGVSAVWTLTAADGTDGGSYRLKVTTPDGVSAITSNLAWNADTATVDAAVEALANVGASGVAAVYNAGTLTLTFASNLGNVLVEVVNDTTNDGGVFEGGWVAVHTTTGVDGRFVTASLIQPNDGSETILTFLPDGFGMKVTDGDGTGIDMPFSEFPVAGQVETAQLIFYPSDASLKTYVKNALRAYAKFTFDDDV